MGSVNAGEGSVREVWTETGGQDEEVQGLAEEGKPAPREEPHVPAHLQPPLLLGPQSCINFVEQDILPVGGKGSQSHVVYT